mgnify:CR=1 FL=1
MNAIEELDFKINNYKFVRDDMRFLIRMVNNGLDLKIAILRIADTVAGMLSGDIARLEKEKETLDELETTVTLEK